VSSVVLRRVEPADVALFFEHQRDPGAGAMAAFPTRAWETHEAQWTRILADDDVVARTVLVDGEVAGNVVSWVADGRRLVGYWLGRGWWGQGIATRALGLLLIQVAERPLHAFVAAHNVASIRVLEKCGFVARERSKRDDVEELRLELVS